MIAIVFKTGEICKSTYQSIYQYNYGQVLRIQGLNLPPAVEVHFSLQNTGGEATTRIGVTKDGVTDVVIPDSLLENGDIAQDYEIYAFVYLRNETSGQTEYKITMHVTSRPKPEAFDRPQDAEIFKEAIKAVNESAARSAESEKQAEGWAHGREDLPERTQDNAKYYSDQAREDSVKTDADRKEVKRLVESVSGIGEQVEKVEGLTKQAQTSATNAALSEQAAKESENNAAQARAGAEAAEDNAELAAQRAEQDKAIVEQAKNIVKQMGQEVLDNKNLVDKTTQDFDLKAQQALADVNNAGQAQTERVQTAGNDAVESVKAAQGTATRAVETAKTEAIEAVQIEGATQAGNVSAEGEKQVQAVQSAAQEIMADREQIQENKTGIAKLKEDLNDYVGTTVTSENLLNLNDPNISHDAWNPHNGSSSQAPQILCSGYIDFKFDDTFCFSLPTSWYSNNVTLYDIDKKLIVSPASFDNGHKQTLSNNLGEFVKFHINTNATYDDKWKNAKYIRFVFWKDNKDFSDLMIIKGETFPNEFIPYKNGFEYSLRLIKEIKSHSADNPLAEKTILFTGDSVCAAYIDNGDGTYGKQYGWAEIIKENNPSIIMKNYGQGGTTVAVKGDSNDSILERLNTMYSEYPNADYIIVEGGVNDCYQPDKIKLGTITQGYNDALDTSTFCGAFESLLKNAILKWKGKKIGYIALFKVPTATNFKDYMDKAKLICEKWSIPYIDLYNQSGLEFNVDEIKALYSYGNGGLHPNVEGYKIITPKIESWIKSL